MFFTCRQFRDSLIRVKMKSQEHVTDRDARRDKLARSLFRHPRMESLEDRRVLANFAGLSAFVGTQLTAFEKTSLTADALNKNFPVIGETLKSQAAGNLLLTKVISALNNNVDDNTDDPVEYDKRLTMALQDAGMTGVVVEPKSNDSFHVLFAGSQPVTVSSFSSGIAVLPISSSSFTVDVGYKFDLTIGIDGGKAFIDATKTKKEFELTASIANANLPAVEVSLGTLTATAKPDATAKKAFDATIAVDITGGERLQAIPVTVAATLTGSANVDLGLMLEFTAGGVKPTVTSDFNLTWQLGANPALPTFTFADVTIDVGSFFSAYGKSAVQNVLETAKPVFQLAEKLDEEIDGLKQLSDEIEGLVGDLSKVNTGIDPLNAIFKVLAKPTYLNVIDASRGYLIAKGQIAQADAVKAFVDAVHTINDVRVLLEQLDTQTLVFHAGTFVLGQGSDIRNATGDLDAQPVSFVPNKPDTNNPMALSKFDAFLVKYHLTTDLTKPQKIFELLVGSNNVNILEYSNDIKPIDLAGVKLLNQNFVIGVVPANFQIAANLYLDPFIRFGFDSRALVDNNVSHGIYVGAGPASGEGMVATENEKSNPIEYRFLKLVGTLDFDFAIGQDYEVASARAGVRAGLILTAAASFVEGSASAGKLHLDEFRGKPIAACDLRGTVDLKARVDLFYEFELGFDIEKALKSLQSLVESVIANNPTDFAVEKLINLATDEYEKIGEQLEKVGVKLPLTSEQLNEILNTGSDPKATLEAIGKGFETVGAKTSAGYKNAASNASKGLGKAKEEGGKILSTVTGGLLLSSKDSKNLYTSEPPLLEWETGACAASETGTTASISATDLDSVVPPTLGSVTNGVLTLFVGSRANERMNVDNTSIDESVIIRPVDTDNPNNGEVYVQMFGQTQQFSGVSRIIASAGNGTNSIDAQGVGATLNFSGGDGPDTFIAGLKAATFFGGDGTNNLIGSPEADDLFGGEGDDTIAGLSGDDFIEGKGGNDTLIGDFASNDPRSDDPLQAGNDRILGGEGNDDIFGGGGNDYINSGAGNDIVDGGEGNDTIHGESGHNTIVGGGGNDFLFSGLGNSNIDGGAGNDQINAGHGTNILTGGTGNDLVVGGDALDLFLYTEGDGDDLFDGAGGQNFLIYETDVRDTQIRLNAVGTQTRLSRVGTPEFLIEMVGIDQYTLFLVGTGGGVSVGDLSGTAARHVEIRLLSDTTSPRLVTIEGTASADNVAVTGSLESVEVSGLPATTSVIGLAATDRIRVNSNEGDDHVKAEPGVEAFVGITLDGGDGDDYLSADAILIGGPGNDFLQGGAGDDMIFGNAGEDTIVGGGGNDTIDGGSGFDTILVQGTAASDTINVAQPNATTLSYTVNGVVDTDTLVAGTVEATRVLTGDGIDTITVTQGDTLTPINSLRVEVIGGEDTTVADRLFVTDAGLGDVVVLRQGFDHASGSYTVGNLSPVVFSGIAYGDVTPKNEITTGTGNDGHGRLVIFKIDPFENNNSLPNAFHLGGGAVINVDPVIDPGVVVDGVAADTDWYQLVAANTGTLDVRLLFEQVGTLVSGRAGLPGNGDLDLTIFDATGDVMGSSTSSTDDERVTFPVVQDNKYFLRVAGATNTAINAFELTIVNESAPVPNFVDLIAASDSGRHDDDDVTNVALASFDIYLDDDRLNSFTNLNLVPDTTNNDAQDAAADFGVEVFNNDVSIGFAFYTGDGNRWRFTATAGDLQEGHNNFLAAAVWVRDRATPSNVGRGILGESLLVTLDTTAPAAPTIALDPAFTDSGIATNPATLADRITKVATPGFVGTAEADNIVRLFADGPVVTNNVINASDTAIGLTVAVPLDGDEAFPAGQYRALSTVNLNNGFPRDGHRQIGATSEDLAGNVSTAAFLDILLDTTPPIVAAVDYPNGSTVFASKPDLKPTPKVDHLLITFAGGPGSAAGLSSPAVDPGLAANIRNYQIVGDHSGNVLIDNALIVSGTPEKVVVRIEFAALLPDDRYTLKINDSISDAAGNLLDGDSSAQAPGIPVIVLPSGNGIEGGDFLARFTVDSRPEFGTISQGLIYVDINGNHVFDPEGQDNDATNRDFVMQFGQLTDAHFAGNFADKDSGVASGFDKLGVYGRFNGTYSFLIDTNDDGVGDFASVMPGQYQVNGIPVAGDFSAAKQGDEIGLFDGQAWYLDTNGNNQIDIGERFTANYNGLPIVGDFNGDGNDDLAVYVNDTNQIVFDTNRDGVANFTWDVKDDVQRFGGLSGFTDRPVAGDINLDGIDDIGLWVKGRQGVLPKEQGEVFFWISDQVNNNPADVFDSYSPAPLGNDSFIHYGDETALPIFGNFDPPVASAIEPTNRFGLTNSVNQYDVNNDGKVTALDALVIINAVSRGQTNAQASQAPRLLAASGDYLDVDSNEIVTVFDALLVINEMNRKGTSTSGSEGESSRRTTDTHLAVIDSIFSKNELDEDDKNDWIESDLENRMGVLS